MSQQETYGQAPDGRTVEGVKVTFRLPSGTVGSVFVPKATYSVNNVKAAIAQYAHQLHQVDNYQG